MTSWRLPRTDPYVFRRWLIAVALAVVAGWLPAVPAQAGPQPGAWTWPVVGPVTDAFDPPDSPYGSGHRGIDIATPLGTPAVAPAPGTVKFAGSVGGRLFVTLDHGGGYESTFSWVSAMLVRKGDAVFEGAPVARTGEGHPGSVAPHLHFGVKLNGAYVDPLSVLAPPSVVDLIHLAPLVPPPAA